MSSSDCIRRKRDGQELSVGDINRVVDGVMHGTLSDAQIGAFLMASFLRGLSSSECEALTRAMAGSGERIVWALDRPVVDKHSTGGVGDKISLMLAPLVAACGAAVPMISGRGLGHTGGTLDKLSSIPGYEVMPGLDRFKDVVRRVGCAVIGQTAELAPADRRLYAIRDVTATVESIPLITASILSKKLAAGITDLVIDLKVGSGAFAATLDDALALEASLTRVGTGAGMHIATVLSDMNQVLGRTAGNALEVAEAVAFLRGDPSEARLRELTLLLAARMLTLSKVVTEFSEGLRAAETAVASGAAAERFGQMVAALGGPADFVERADVYLAKAPLTVALEPAESGYVKTVDTRAIGLAVIELGGGRQVETDAIDYAVGLSEMAGIGEFVGPGAPLARCHARSERRASAALELVRSAYSIVPEATSPSLVLIRA